MTVAVPAAAATHPPAAHPVPLRGSLAPAQERSHPDGQVAPGSRVSFDLLLSLRNASGAAAFVRQVSTPGSAQFRHYLTDSQWEARFGPARAGLTRAKSWLRGNGFSVGAVARDGLFVAASGTARGVERAFSVKLGYYKVNGHRLRLAEGTMTIPSSLAGTVAGAVGVNQYVDTPSLSAAAGAATAAASHPGGEPPPPAGFRNARPCSAYWGQKTDTKDSGSLYKPYHHPLPYDICGYKPAQLRGAYGMSGKYTGKGVTIAIVDAYDSPTLLPDAQRYYKLNDPAIPLGSGQFVNVQPKRPYDETLCAGSGWYDEQSLDVESSHAMAPGAKIEYVGARSCLDDDLLAAVTTAVTSGASVVTDSWDDLLGDVFEDAATRAAYDDTFMLAASTGVSVLFCSHDYGDNFATFGLTIQNYPATSPYVTAVGGTALEVNAKNERQAEYGWSTGRKILCESKTTSCGSATKPLEPLAYDNGGAGGTSYTYTEPYYQDKVVPKALALRNEAVNGDVPYRVVPDISMDSDPQTGFLIGLTQAFPNGTYYDQFKEGGTSLASPLLAGVIADADQAAGTPLGFLNPVLYKAYTQTPGAFDDIRLPADPDSAALIRVDYANDVNSSQGYVISMRVLNYEGPETYCDATGNCATRDVSLTTGRGFDSMTGMGSVGRGFVTTLGRF